MREDDINNGDRVQTFNVTIIAIYEAFFRFTELLLQPPMYIYGAPGKENKEIQL